MSYFNTEDENRAQRTEGFNCGFESGESLYVLTPEEPEQQSELDEQIYEENPVVNNELVSGDEPELTIEESTTPVATVSAPVASKKVSYLVEYVTNPDNRMRMLLVLVILCVGLYYLYSEGYVSLPSLSSLPSGMSNALGLDSATSSFAASTSLGQNYMKLNSLL